MSHFYSWFARNILGINAHVPWKTHWASVVSSPTKIYRDDETLQPGEQPFQYIQAMNGIHFGKNVHLSPGVRLVSANHDFLDYYAHSKAEPLIIDDDCWLGVDVTVLAGVHLQPHTVVLDGSVVTKDSPGNCVLAGVPAVVIKQLAPYQSNEDQ